MISVPVKNQNVIRQDKQKILTELKSMDAKRVFLALGQYILSKEAREKEMQLLKENCKFFKENGYEVGAWFWTFWVREKNEFVKMKGATGEVSKDFVCPSDESFREFAKEWIQEIAACGVDLIMFDDDYRYGFFDIGMGCTCENHIAYMESLLGEKLNESDLKYKLLKGGKNKYRDAWLAANRYYFELFAKEMREALDTVDKNIRLGFCSCISSWETDGIDPVAIARILAGNTKPFMRLIGAPYWAVRYHWGNRLQNVIELIRMEKSWCKDKNIEIFAEGDTYPRPRTQCPANYLELYDMAMRADGQLDGILKYGIDYYSSAGYETGYSKRHMRNRKIYDEIHNAFQDKKSCGVRVYEKMNKFADFEIPSEKECTCEVQNIFFSIAARMITDSSIPTVYEGYGICGIAFGENVNLLDENALKRGVIIDAKGAKILQSKGIDVGIISVGKKINVEEEHFIELNEVVGCSFKAYDIKISDKSKILSKFVYKNQDKITVSEAIGAYIYTNKEGYKFLVFAFDAYFNNEHIYRSYARSLQLKTAIEKFFGAKLPAYSYGNPDFYIMAKKNESEMAVGLWNICADSVLEPVIELDHSYTNIRFIHCKGRMVGDKVLLEEIPPFAFAGFVVN